MEARILNLPFALSAHQIAPLGSLTERLVEYRPEMEKNPDARLSPDSIANVRMHSRFIELSSSAYHAVVSVPRKPG
jgi:hypothetical protein